MTAQPKPSKWSMIEPSGPRGDLKPSLVGLEARVARAAQQFKALVAKVNKRAESKTYSVGTYFNDDACLLYARFLVRRPPPVRWSLGIGELVHNLHSILDHLAWQVFILANGREPTGTDLAFPVFLTREGFENNAPKKMRGFGAKAAALIKSLQPIATGEKERSPLWHLYCLSIWDKHKDAAFSFYAPARIAVSGTLPHDTEYVECTERGRLEHKTVVASVKLRPSTRPMAERVRAMDVKFEVAPYPAFLKPDSLAGADLRPVVRHAVVRTFAIVRRFKKEIFT